MRTREALEGGEHRRPTQAPEDKVAPESQSTGSPWDTDSVTSWVSPNIKKSKES